VRVNRPKSSGGEARLAVTPKAPLVSCLGDNWRRIADSRESWRPKTKFKTSWMMTRRVPDHQMFLMPNLSEFIHPR